MDFGQNKKIGILGGSFDPIHKAHLELARAAKKQLGLDEVFFIPAKQAALRDEPASASDDDRIAMIKLAIQKAEFPHKIILDEMKRGNISYSIDTARKLEKEYPNCKFYWIIGADHIAKLDKWKDISELSKIVTFVCAARRGCDMDKSLIPSCAKVDFIDFIEMPHSSTEIRNLIKNGGNADFLLDPDVKKYISDRKLYNK